MATFSRVTPTGWLQDDDASDASRVTPTGWQQSTAVGGGGNASTTLTGASASAAVGSLTASGAAQIVITGIQVTASTGTVSAAGGTATWPTLSSASIINITATTATPRVYVTLPA